MVQNFRKSIGGFNREDVVQYIEFINNRHNTQVNQLKAELQTVKYEIAAAQQDASVKEELESVRAQLDAALAEKAEAELLKAETESLKAEVAALKTELEAKSNECADRELEAYRRAERVERTAKERVTHIYAQVNSVLERVTRNSECTADQISQVVDSFARQITDMQAALEKSKQSIREAAETMKTIRPVEPDC